MVDQRAIQKSNNASDEHDTEMGSKGQHTPEENRIEKGEEAPKKKRRQSKEKEGERSRNPHSKARTASAISPLPSGDSAAEKAPKQTKRGQMAQKI